MKKGFYYWLSSLPLILLPVLFASPPSLHIVINPLPVYDTSELKLILPEIVRQGEVFTGKLLQKDANKYVPVENGQVIYRGTVISTGSNGILKIPAFDREPGNTFCTVQVMNSSGGVKYFTRHVEIISMPVGLPTQIAGTSAIVNPGQTIRVEGQGLNVFKKAALINNNGREIILEEPVGSSLQQTCQLPEDIPAGTYRFVAWDAEGKKYEAPDESKKPVLQMQGPKIRRRGQRGNITAQTDVDGVLLLSGGEPQLVLDLSHINLQANKISTIGFTAIQLGDYVVKGTLLNPEDIPDSLQAGYADARLDSVLTLYDDSKSVTSITSFIQVTNTDGRPMKNCLTDVAIAYPYGISYHRLTTDNNGKVQLNRTVAGQYTQSDIAIHVYRIPGYNWKFNRCVMKKCDTEDAVPIKITSIEAHSKEIEYGEPVYIKINAVDYDFLLFNCVCNERGSKLKVPVDDKVGFEWELVEDKEERIREAKDPGGFPNYLDRFVIGDDPAKKGIIRGKDGMEGGEIISGTVGKKVYGDLIAYLPPVLSMVRAHAVSDVYIKENHPTLPLLKGPNTASVFLNYELFKRKIKIKVTAMNIAGIDDCPKHPDAKNEKIIELEVIPKPERVNFVLNGDGFPEDFPMQVVFSAKPDGKPGQPEAKKEGEECLLSFKWKEGPAPSVSLKDIRTVFPGINPVGPGMDGFLYYTSSDMDILEVTCTPVECPGGETKRYIVSDPLRKGDWSASKGSILFAGNSTAIFRAQSVSPNSTEHTCATFKSASIIRNAFITPENKPVDPEKFFSVNWSNLKRYKDSVEKVTFTVTAFNSHEDGKCVQVDESGSGRGQARVDECNEAEDPAHLHPVFNYLAAKAKAHEKWEHRIQELPVNQLMLDMEVGAKLGMLLTLSKLYCAFDGYCLNSKISLGNLSLITGYLDDNSHKLYDHNFIIDPKKLEAAEAGALYVEKQMGTGIPYGDFILAVPPLDFLPHTTECPPQSPRAKTHGGNLYHEAIHMCQQDASDQQKWSQGLISSIGVDKLSERDAYYLFGGSTDRDLFNTLDRLRCLEEHMKANGKGCSINKPGRMRKLWDQALLSIYALHHLHVFVTPNGNAYLTKMSSQDLATLQNYTGINVPFKSIVESLFAGECHRYSYGIPLRRLLPQPPNDIYPK